MPEETKDKAADKMPTDLPGAIAALAEERKTSAGRDRKISEYQKELDTMRAQLTEAQAAAEGRTEQDAGSVARMMEIAADLKAREKEMADKQAALQAAVEKGVSVNLLLRGAGDLDNYLKELGEFQRQTLKGAGYREKKVEKPGELKLERLSKKEIARIPSKILDKLMGAGK